MPGINRYHRLDLIDSFDPYSQAQTQRMSPTRQDLEQLSQQLPPLVFSPEVDSFGAESSLAQAYLDYYQINFAREFAGLAHGFGQIQSGDFHIAANYWLPAQPRGTVVVVHGYYDHTGIYCHPLRMLLE